ncbi:MAG: bifunctional phosphoribosylaminoimidazolecarboxamide formyltransferase/IMP cyclohydrolase [Candidatus Obscuribacterales bacterium]|nr:bifunctional phosphoribosylaminoimidazolecarboxamide formyltransferase/IMP cyclohydrolase [Candidatus Obscuribacterales bacterium]
MPSVLVSVSDKSGLENFIRRLERFDDVRLIATSSTAKFLSEKGFKVTKVEDLTKFPEILSGRVKTLHPKVLAGILSRPSKEDRDCLAEHEIEEIDIVVVNLYPFEKKLEEKLAEHEMVEQIDVGGVTLLRAAAKNFARVAVISDPKQYDMIIESLDCCGGKFTDGLRKELAQAAFLRTAQYDSSISSYMARTLEADGLQGYMPETMLLRLDKIQDLRYGENPHHAAAWYASADNSAQYGIKLPPFKQLQGKDLSFNNITDVYAVLNILRAIKGNGACIIKHNNPCGVAIDKDIMKAFQKAYDCDPISAFGGIYGFSTAVSEELAQKITENFVEIVLAPAFDQKAMAVFAKKKNLRVLEIPADLLDEKYTATHFAKDLRYMGVLVEKELEASVEAESFRVVTETELDPSYKDDVAFAWGVVRHLTSNAIFVARNGLSLGFGIGQTNRVQSVKHALEQAGEKAKAAVLVSDAFFPATDNIEEAAKAGIKVIVQPGGSIKDEEVIKACNAHGICMLFTGQRCFRH